MSDGDNTRMLVGAGDVTPIGGVFAKFSERLALNEAGVVAFTAVLNNAGAREAVFVVDGAAVRKIAALGDSAPGAGVFSHFGPWPALSADGAVAFIASLDRGSADVGVFVAAGSRLTRVAALGDALPGGVRLASFGLYPVVSMAPNGALTFVTAPTATREGVEAIFNVGTAAR